MDSKTNFRVIYLGNGYRVVERGETDFIIEEFGTNTLGSTYWASVSKLNEETFEQDDLMWRIAFSAISLLFQAAPGEGA